MNDPMVESLVQTRTLLRQNAVGHRNAGSTEQVEPFAGMFRIGISCADKYASDASGDDCLRARRCPPVSRAGFESDIEGSTFRAMRVRGSITERFDFCVRLAGTTMPTATHDLATLDHHRSNHWIGRGQAVPTLR